MYFTWIRFGYPSLTSLFLCFIIVNCQPLFSLSECFIWLCHFHSSTFIPLVHFVVSCPFILVVFICSTWLCLVHSSQLYSYVPLDCVCLVHASQLYSYVSLYCVFLSVVFICFIWLCLVHSSQLYSYVPLDCLSLVHSSQLYSCFTWFCLVHSSQLYWNLSPHCVLSVQFIFPLMLTNSVYIYRYEGSNTGKRARRKNLRHPRERFLVSNEAQPSWRPIEIFPASVLRFFRLALLPVFDSFSH